MLSAFGYHLIKVEKRSGGKVTARHILIPIEITGQHRDQLDARADSLESLGAEKIDPAALDTAARALGLRVGRADPLQKGSRVQVGLQVVPDAGIWAFQAKPGETGRIVEVSYAYFLFRLDSLQAEGVPPFEMVKDAVTYAVRNDKKFDVARTIGDGSPEADRRGQFARPGRHGSATCLTSSSPRSRAPIRRCRMPSSREPRSASRWGRPAA